MKYDRINIEQMVRDMLIALDEERGIFFCMSSPDCLECEPVSMDFAIASMTDYITSKVERKGHE